MENTTTSLRLVPGAWKNLLSKFDTRLAHRLVILILLILYPVPIFWSYILTDILILLILYPDHDPDPDPGWIWPPPTSMTFPLFHSNDISISSPDRFITSCSKLRTLYLSGWVVSFYNWSTLLWFWKALLIITLTMSSDNGFSIQISFQEYLVDWTMTT